MIQIAASPFASLFGLFLAVPISLIVGVTVADGIASSRAGRPRRKTGSAASPVPARAPGGNGVDLAPGIVWG